MKRKSLFAILLVILTSFCWADEESSEVAPGKVTSATFLITGLH